MYTVESKRIENIMLAYVRLSGLHVAEFWQGQELCVSHQVHTVLGPTQPRGYKVK